MGFKEKTHHEKPKVVTLSECLRAANEKMTQYGKLQKKSESLWATSVGEYRRAWLKTKRYKYAKFVLVRYKAFVVGAETTIRQELTQTPCIVAKKFCRPLEIPSSIIAWKELS